MTILNPGSISKPRQADHRYTYMVMEIDDEDEVTYELGMSNDEETVE